MSQEEYQFDEASVQAIMHWAETAQLPKEVVLSESEHIYDTSLYVRANINDIKQHYPDAFYNPAIIRLYRLKEFVEGLAEGIMVGMCGEAAADPKLIPLLLAFGLDEFSVSATSVLKTRKTISDCNIDECKALAEKVMKCVTEEEVLELLK